MAPLWLPPSFAGRSSVAITLVATTATPDQSEPVEQYPSHGQERDPTRPFYAMTPLRKQYAATPVPGCDGLPGKS